MLHDAGLTCEKKALKCDSLMPEFMNGHNIEII